MAWTITRGNKSRLDGYSMVAAGAGTQLTVSAWCKTDSFATAQRIMGEGGSMNYSPWDGYWQLMITNTGGAYFGTGDGPGGGNGDDTQGGSSTVNTWHHFAGVLNTTTITAYLDGVQVGTRSTTFVNMPNLNYGMFNLGNFDDRGFYYGGDFAEWAVWSTALSAGEVAALGKGVSPWLLRVNSLLMYVPFMVPPEADGLKKRAYDIHKNKNILRTYLDNTAVSQVNYHPPVGRFAP